MTDNEIIKALECLSYGGHSCMNCKHKIDKGDDRCGLKGCNIARNALDLINRQKAEIEKYIVNNNVLKRAVEVLKKDLDKANAEIEELQTDGETLAISIINAKKEIERLNKLVVELNANISQSIHQCQKIKSEAIKEFAERLKEKAYVDDGVTGFQDVIVAIEDIDTLVAEMTVNYESSKKTISRERMRGND